jgi:hypothetical protein
MALFTSFHNHFWDRSVATVLIYRYSDSTVCCFIVLLMSEYDTLQRAIWSTALSNYPYKAYSLECVVMEPCFQYGPHCSLHESQIWHSRWRMTFGCT